MSEKASPLTLALERLTVFDVWKLLGLEGTAKPFCRSPFRGDRNPSFSIYDGGHRWQAETAETQLILSPKPAGSLRKMQRKNLSSWREQGPRTRKTLVPRTGRTTPERLGKSMTPLKIRRRQPSAKIGRALKFPPEPRSERLQSSEDSRPRVSPLPSTMAFYSALTSPKAGHGLSLIPAG